MSTKGIEMPSGLELYPHNEKAYRKLLDMLSETRRACIIHPTGTGKAFIAYRYAFDHPKERMKNWEDLAPCPHCGAILPVGAQFCPDCGKEI